MSREIGVGHGAGTLGVQHVVDDVKDAVGEEDVGVEELGAVDVDVVAGVADGDVVALLGGPSCAV